MEPELTAQAAELLEKAADGFESGRYYWTKGKYHRMVYGTHAYCSMGALAHENGQEDKQLGIEMEPVRIAARALADQVNPSHGLPIWQGGGGIVVGWNDHVIWDDELRITRERTKQEVIDAMKQAAKDLRNG